MTKRSLNHAPEETQAPPLPANTDAERAVLGAVVVNNESLAAAAKVLSPQDFFYMHHGNLFKLMLEMQASGTPIDSLTLFDAATRDGGVERLGGIEYLSTIGDGVPRVSNVEHYAGIVLRAARLRRIALLGDGLAQEALNPQADPDALTDRLSEISISCGSATVIPGHKRFRSAADILTGQSAEICYVAGPWLAVGCLTELNGKVKLAGKTTLALALTRSVLDGLPFLGNPTQRSAVVYLSESPAPSFIPAMQRAGIGIRADFSVGFWSELAALPWEAVVRSAVEECKRIDARLLIIDTLGQFTGLAAEGENDAATALTAMRPLQLAAAQGLAILLLRHERKSGGTIAEAGRGSSAISGSTDIIVNLRRPEGHSNGRLRILEAIGRLPDIPTEQLMIELTDSGYTVQGSRQGITADAARTAIISAIRLIRLNPSNVVEPNQKLTIQGIAALAKVSPASTKRLLADLYRDGVVVREGSGERGDPYRFDLAQPNPGVENREPNPQSSTGRRSAASLNEAVEL